MAVLGWILVGFVSFAIGLRLIFDRDWAWKRHLAQNRRRGRRLERTREWEVHTFFSGIVTVSVGVLSLVMLVNTI
jgi:hypothetical protein